MPKRVFIIFTNSKFIRNLTFVAVFMVCFLSGGRAYAAGGACPSGANYLDPSTGSMVTLSSLGVTNCYYISASGSDSNNGASESAPWLHAPQMPSCAGNCAAVQSATVPAGTGFIFRGGDTWHLGNSGASPYTGGTWDFNTSPYPNGTSSHPIYIGVDQGWYSGGSWVRPVLNADNPLCNLSTLGPNCIQNTNHSLSQVVYTNTCAYQTAPNLSGSNNNDIIGFGNRQYFMFDNFEMMGLCESDTNVTKDDKYVSYNSATGMVFTNLYLHGQSHVQFNFNGDCNQIGAAGSSSVCFNISPFAGSGGPPGETIAHCVVDGSDSDPGGWGLFFPGLYNTYGNVFRYLGQGIYRNLHTFQDNLLEHWYQPGDNAAHGNLFESDGEYPATDAIYNNIFRHICSDSNACPGGIVGILPQPPIGQAEYVFNNLYYDVTKTQYYDLGGPVDVGTQYIFNNIWQVNSPGSALYGCAGVQGGSQHSYRWLSINNQIIDDQSPYLGLCATAGQEIATPQDLVMSVSTATSAGYTQSETYAYAPPTSSSPTVGTGTNEGTTNRALCSALTSAASSDSLLSDAASACQGDTRYACSYNSITHINSCPARTVVARPISVAWDAGAYQYSASQGQIVQPPTNLQATVQ